MTGEHPIPSAPEADPSAPEAAVPTVEIGMPTRGNSPYVREALDSIFAQTFADWRLVVAENGSGDASFAELLEPYLRDPRVQHVVHGVDLGLAGNHTKIVQAARSEYVAILHDDDRWEPQFLERRVAFLERHPECAFVFGAFDTIDEDGTVLATRHAQLPVGVVQPSEFIPAMLRANVIGMPTVLVRRSEYDRAGAFTDDDFPMIDYDMWIRLGSRSPVGHLDVNDAAWRFHSRQRSARVQHWGEAWLRFYDSVDRTLAAAGELPVDRAHLHRQRAASHICAALDAIEAREPDRARNHLRRAVATRQASVLDPRVAVAGVALRFSDGGSRLVPLLRRGAKEARRTLGPRAASLRAAARRHTR